MGSRSSFVLPRPAHARITARVLFETAGIYLALLATLVWASRAGAPWWFLAIPVVLQGFWLQRIYVVGHEASHRKLWPFHRPTNDLLGQVALLAIAVPLPIFRKIHAFHHGANRRDVHTSALDTFVIPKGAGPLRRAWCYLVWYLAVFGGGWFIHSLVSILFFLFLPLSVARKVSPAFRGWTRRDQLTSIAIFGFIAALHVGFASVLGVRTWLIAQVAPLLVFAWVYSAQLYIYHYRTTMGPKVRFHARSLRASPLTSWWLLQLNEHATHHRDPTVPWYALADAHQEPPAAFAGNQQVEGFAQAVAWQLSGPVLDERP